MEGYCPANWTLSRASFFIKYSNQPNPDGNLALYIATTPYGITSPGIVFQQGSQYNYSTVVSASIILEPGNTIHFSVNSGNSSFQAGPIFVSVNYSEIP